MKRTLQTIKLPDLISVANGVLGYAACLMALENFLSMAAATIIFASVLDGIDGTVARKIEFSDIGRVLDSFSDLISFGVAPALMVYRLNSSELSIAVSSAFVICGALRLARFTVMTSENFTGFPITASGLLISLLYILGTPSSLLTLLMAILSALMISEVEYVKIRDFRALSVLLFFLIMTIAGTLLSLERISKIFALLSLSLILLYLVSPLLGGIVNGGKRTGSV